MVDKVKKGIYRCRNGNIFVVTRVATKTYGRYPVSGYYIHNKKITNYNSRGEFIINEETDKDLVAYIGKEEDYPEYFIWVIWLM